MSYSIEIDEDGNGIPSEIVLNDESHSLEVTINADNKYVKLQFSTSQAMRDFAKNLLHASYYGTGSIELYPLGSENGLLVVDGVRLTKNSARVFIEYPQNSYKD